jgi:hypothetical protein
LTHSRGSSNSQANAHRVHTVTSTTVVQHKSPAPAPSGEGRVALVRQSTGDYGLRVPAGWRREESDKPSSDRSYLENLWYSPTHESGLLIDESPGSSASPSTSAAKIAADLRQANEPIYYVRNDVTIGGVLGSELAFRANSARPERVDFFFNLGTSGFAVLGTASSQAEARALVHSVVPTIRFYGE